MARRARISCLLRHPARKRNGSIFFQPRTTYGSNSASGEERVSRWSATSHPKGRATVFLPPPPPQNGTPYTFDQTVAYYTTKYYATIKLDDSKIFHGQTCPWHWPNFFVTRMLKSGLFAQTNLVNTVRSCNAPSTVSLATFSLFCRQKYAITHISNCFSLSVFSVATSHISLYFFHLRSFFLFAHQLKLLKLSSSSTYHSNFPPVPTL